MESQYLDHEVRLRLLEHVTVQINYKMNTAIVLLISGIIIPLVLHWLGAR